MSALRQSELICFFSKSYVDHWPKLRPNPSLKRSANGRPPGPVWRYAVHFRHPGPRVTPLVPT